MGFSIKLNITLVQDLNSKDQTWAREATCHCRAQRRGSQLRQETSAARNDKFTVRASTSKSLGIRVLAQLLHSILPESHSFFVPHGTQGRWSPHSLPTSSFGLDTFPFVKIQFQVHLFGEALWNYVDHMLSVAWERLLASLLSQQWINRNLISSAGPCGSESRDRTFFLSLPGDRDDYAHSCTSAPNTAPVTCQLFGENLLSKGINEQIGWPGFYVAIYDVEDISQDRHFCAPKNVKRSSNFGKQCQGE